MFNQIKIKDLKDYFKPCNSRGQKGVYFARLNDYDEIIHQFIYEYIEKTITSGICMSNRIENPTDNQLKYYDEMMGRDYRLSPDFFTEALSKWLPRVKTTQKRIIANYFYDVFYDMAKQGKNDNIQKNAYIKFMCWLYYKFEPILHQLGNETLPKILFEGYVNKYELLMFSILSKAGCDILLLQYQGDETYLKVDPSNTYSERIDYKGKQFPQGYSIFEIRKQIATKMVQKQPITKPVVSNVKLIEIVPPIIINTNAWLEQEPMEAVLLTQEKRGLDQRFYYNTFVGIYGAEDTATYFTDLAKWKLKVEGKNKTFILVENEIEPPSNEEISRIKRKNYQTSEELVNDLIKMIQCNDRKLLPFVQACFLQQIQIEMDLPITKLYNKAVIYVCLLNRYLKKFKFETQNTPVFVLYSELSGKYDKILLCMLSKLPIDVIHINPNLSTYTEIDDKLFFAKKYLNSLNRGKFPQNINQVSFQTAAFQAERDLDTILYQDTGVYRDHQFKKAIPIPLSITYEEIKLYWKEEAKFRPDFEVLSDKVMLPVIFSKVSGLNCSIEDYWYQISEYLEQKDVYLIRQLPSIDCMGVNPFKDKAYQFLKNGKLDIRKMKAHPSYPFSFIKDTMQDFMLTKLNELIDSEIIKGTFKNGVEYTIISTVLNLNKAIIRMIQKYDFTKDIPKIVLIHTKDGSGIVEDSIVLAYLNMLGFDIVMFVPTGYTTVESYYTRPIFIEHQIGEYQYDLTVPNFDEVKRKKNSLVNKFLRRR